MKLDPIQSAAAEAKASVHALIKRSAPAEAKANASSKTVTNGSARPHKTQESHQKYFFI